ncbi:TetR/AcrR family transcriptional regulator [Bacillus sp. sid0103]|uniref:TetR/AcrR family transcriptional regulator n=1 Tax=Bacillus sp. sid0103 TaxID=2856337 RepID=UPI001C4463EE|nr:TetR/AcrR family transcriptional regulator [Bacillus sp. sid0103]MBV7507757.1 TetR/AcrR family transcriptional regulator [Bacillus sp. sid0103]
MNDRKLHVVNMAHQLFIDKGFQATSIQDILDYSGISKGTFYNYFSSKSELLIAIYKTIYKKLEKDRNDLLIGQNPSSIEIFIKQVEMQMISNRKNKLIALYEEVLSSNDADLKQFVQRSRLNALRWYFNRFIDIFGEGKKPFLLDCAIMFQGILQHNVQYNRMAHESGEKISSVVRYSVARIVKMVDEVSESGEQLIEPKTLEKWVPGCEINNQEIITQLMKITVTLRSSITKSIQEVEEQNKYNELLDFIQEEIIHTRSPRKYLIQSALLSLKQNPATLWKKELGQLNELIESFYSLTESIDTTP